MAQKKIQPKAPEKAEPAAGARKAEKSSKESVRRAKASPKRATVRRAQAH